MSVSRAAKQSSATETNQRRPTARLVLTIGRQQSHFWKIKPHRIHSPLPQAKTYHLTQIALFQGPLRSDTESMHLQDVVVGWGLIVGMLAFAVAASVAHATRYTIDALVAESTRQDSLSQA